MNKEIKTNAKRRSVNKTAGKPFVTKPSDNHTSEAFILSNPMFSCATTHSKYLENQYLF